MWGRLIVASTVLAGALASATPAAPTAEVTMGLQRLSDGRVRFEGRISSGQQHEYVTVLARRCGQSSFTAFTGSSTEEGGFWHVDAYQPGNGVYRAKWNDTLSRPITIGAPAPVTLTLTKLPGKRFRVWIFAQSNLNRKPVALQRLAGGRWVNVRQQRLQSAGAAGQLARFETVFKVRKRGLRLRVLVPETTAAPCHAATHTETFRS